MDERGHPGEIDADALLAQSGWVSALARGLVHDRAAAEDAVQETWLAALRHAPREPGRLRPWLAHVLANVARKQRRGDTHRAEREAHAARREGLPSAGDVAAKLEAQRMLVAALDALDDPYKTTIVLRYFDGLDSAEIARRANVPAGTVRWRLREGLHRLRTKLDADAHGDRTTWALAFAPFVPPPALSKLAASALAASPGVVLMSVLSRGTWIAAAVVLAALGVYVWNERAERDALADTAHADALAPSDTSASPGASPLEPLDARELSTDERASATTHAPNDSVASAIEGRAVAEDRAPLAGVAVEAKGLAPCAPSAADGRFRVAGPFAAARDGVQITLRAPGRATRFETARDAGTAVVELGELVLVRTAELRGRVVDGAGMPRAGARVIAATPAVMLPPPELLARKGLPANLRVAETTTGIDGRFVIADAAPGVLRAVAEHARVGASASAAIELPAIGFVDIGDLVLEPCAACDTIAGRVLDPNGSACAGATVKFTWRPVQTEAVWEHVAVDDDGRFAIPVTSLGERVLWASDAARRWPQVSATALPGDANVSLRFTNDTRIHVRVRDERGELVRGARIGTRTVRVDAAGVSPSSTSLGGSDAGELRIARPSRTFFVVADAARFAAAEAGPFEPATAPSEFELVLTRLPVVRGRVVADGVGVGGAQVTAHELQRDLVHERAGFPVRFDPGQVAEVVCDADGWFELPLRTAGHFAVLADAPGFALADVELTVADLARAAERELEIALVRGGAIEGVVLAPKGRDPAGTIVVLNRYDGRARTLRADREGRFAARGLTPGAWNVSVSRREIEPGRGATASATRSGRAEPLPTNCTVVDGEVTRFELDLAAIPVAVWTAHLTLDGAPALGWKYALWEDLPGSIDDEFLGSFDARGDARVELPPARYRLEIRPPDGFGARVTLETTLDLARGEHVWSMDLAAGRVEGTIAPVLTERSMYDLAWERDGLHASFSVQSNAEGRFTVQWVPAGRVELRAWERGGRDGPTVAAELTVVRGETARVDLR